MIVTFETAKKLKEAGFPQPEKTWYGVGIYDDFDDKQLHFYSSRIPIDWREHWLFAPSATDILKELGEKWNLHYDGHPESYTKQWCCYKEGTTTPFYHMNPAEACAAAWLARKVQRN